MSNNLYDPFIYEKQSSTKRQCSLTTAPADGGSKTTPSPLGPGSSYSSSVTASSSWVTSPTVLPLPVSRQPECARAGVSENVEWSAGVLVGQVGEEARSPISGKNSISMEDEAILSTSAGINSGSMPSFSKGLIYPRNSHGLPNYSISTRKEVFSIYSSSASSSGPSSMFNSSSQQQSTMQSIPFFNDHQPSPVKPPVLAEPSCPEYNLQSAAIVLQNLGLDKDDLEELISYPEEQTTPENLPFILHQIHMRKAKRALSMAQPVSHIEPRPNTSVSGMDRPSHSGGAGVHLDEMSSVPPQPSEVTDYGCSGSVGDDIGRASGSGTNSGVNAVMLPLDNNDQTREPLQKSTTVMDFSGVVSSHGEGGSVISPSSFHDLVRSSAAAPSSDDQTSHSAIGTLSFASEDAVSTPQHLKSEVSKPPTGKESRPTLLPTPNTQPSSTPVPGIPSGKHGIVVFDSHKNPSQTQGRGLTEQMKTQEIQEQPKHQPLPSVTPQVTDLSPPRARSVFISSPAINPPAQPVSGPVEYTHVPLQPSLSQSTAKGGIAKDPAKSDIKPVSSVMVKARTLPHTCSSCNKEFSHVRDWLAHQKTSLHRENSKSIQKSFTSKDVEPSPATSGQAPKLCGQKTDRKCRSRSRSCSPRCHSPAKRKRSSSSRSKSPGRRRHGLEGRSYKCRSRSRSPYSSRSAHRSRSRSCSPWYSRRISSRRRSRSSSRERRMLSRKRDERQPIYKSRGVRRSPMMKSRERRSSSSSSDERRLASQRRGERRSPLKKSRERRSSSSSSDERRLASQRRGQRRSPLKKSRERRSSSSSSDERRSSQRKSFKRRSSPPRKRSISAERLAKKLLKVPAVQSLSAQCNVEAVVASLVPALLAEITKEMASTTPATSAASPSSSSKESTTQMSNVKTQRLSENSVSSKPKTAQSSPPTMLKLGGICESLSRSDVIASMEVFGKTKSVLLFRSKEQASVCFEKVEDAEKLRSSKSFDIKGTPVIVVSEEVTAPEKPPTTSAKEQQKKSVQLMSSASTPTVTQTTTERKGFLSTPSSSTDGSEKRTTLTAKAKVLVPRSQDALTKQTVKQVKVPNLALKGSVKPTSGRLLKTAASSSAKQPEGTSKMFNSRGTGPEADDAKQKPSSKRCETSGEQVLSSLEETEKVFDTQEDSTSGKQLPALVELKEDGKIDPAVVGNGEISKDVESTRTVQTMATEPLNDTPQRPPTPIKDSSLIQCPESTASGPETTATEPLNDTPQRPPTPIKDSSLIQCPESTASGPETTATEHLNDTPQRPPTPIRDSSLIQCPESTASGPETTATEHLNDTPQRPPTPIRDSSLIQCPESTTGSSPEVAVEPKETVEDMQTELEKKDPVTVAEIHEEMVFEAANVSAAATSTEVESTATATGKQQPAAATLTSTTVSRTFQDNINMYLKVKNIECLSPDNTYAHQACPNDPLMIFLTGLPRYPKFLYTEGDVVDMLTSFGFKYRHYYIYVMPQTNMAFALMPDAHSVDNILKASLTHGIYLSKHKLSVKVLNLAVDSTLPMNPFYFYKFLAKSIGCWTKDIRLQTIYIENISPRESSKLQEFLRAHDRIVNLLPLLNKVFIQFESEADADWILVWFSLLKQTPKYRMYRVQPNCFKDAAPPPRLPANIVPDSREMKTGAVMPPKIPAVLPPIASPFWVTLTTEPFAFMTISPWFNIPDYVTMSKRGDLEKVSHHSSALPTVMLTNVPACDYRHEDVAKLVWPYFPEQNLQSLYYNVTVLSLQRRAFVYFSSWDSCCDFIRDHIRDPVSVGGCKLGVHYVSEDMHPGFTEETMYRSLMKWSNNHVPELDSLEERLLCVTVSEMSPGVFTGILKGVASIAPFLSFLPLTNRVCIEMAESSGVAAVLGKIRSPTSGFTGKLSPSWTSIWIKIQHMESVMTLKERLRRSSKITIDLGCKKRPSSAGGKKRAPKTTTSFSSFTCSASSSSSTKSPKPVVPAGSLNAPAGAQTPTVTGILPASEASCDASAPTAADTGPTAAAASKQQPTFWTDKSIAKSLKAGKIGCIRRKIVMSAHFPSRGKRVLLIKNLPEYDKCCYTEEEIASGLVPFGFRCQSEHIHNIFVIPQARLAIFSMPCVEAVRTILTASIERKTQYRGRVCMIRVTHLQDVIMSPFQFYKQLTKWMNYETTDDEKTTVYIENISPSETTDLGQVLKRIGCVKSYLPLLNKVFVEFETPGDVDRLGVWHSLLKRGHSYRIYRLWTSPSQCRPLPLQLAANGVPDGKDKVTGAEIPPKISVVPQGSSSPFWVTMTTHPFTFPTLCPWFNIPDHVTIGELSDLEKVSHHSSALPTVMLTGLPISDYQHKDVAKLVLPYFPEQNLHSSYYNVTVLPLQRRAFVYFGSWDSCCNFIRDHISNPVNVRGHKLSVHYVSEDMHPGFTEETMYRSLMKWSNTHVPELESLEECLLCVEVTEMTLGVITAVVKEVASIAPFVSFLPLANRMCIEMEQSCKVATAMMKIDWTGSKTLDQVQRIESVSRLKLRLQECSRNTPKNHSSDRRSQPARQPGAPTSGHGEASPQPEDNSTSAGPKPLTAAESGVSGERLSAVSTPKPELTVGEKTEEFQTPTQITCLPWRTVTSEKGPEDGSPHVCLDKGEMGDDTGDSTRDHDNSSSGGSPGGRREKQKHKDSPECNTSTTKPSSSSSSSIRASQSSSSSCPGRSDKISSAAAVETTHSAVAQSDHKVSEEGSSAQIVESESKSETQEMPQPAEGQRLEPTGESQHVEADLKEDTQNSKKDKEPDEKTDEEEGDEPENSQILDSIGDEPEEQMDEDGNSNGSSEIQTVEPELDQSEADGGFRVLDSVGDEDPVDPEESREVEVDASVKVQDEGTEDQAAAVQQNPQLGEDEGLIVKTEEDELQVVSRTDESADENQVLDTSGDEKTREKQREGNGSEPSKSDDLLSNHRDTTDGSLSIDDQTRTGDTGQKGETSKDQTGEADIKPTKEEEEEEEEEAYQVIDSVDEQQTSSNTEPETKNRRTRRQDSTVKKEDGPPRRSGRRSRTSETEQKEKSPIKSPLVAKKYKTRSKSRTPGRDPTIKKSTEETICEAVDSVKDGKIQDETEKSVRRRSTRGNKDKTPDRTGASEKAEAENKDSAGDETTVATRSTRGRRGKTPKADSSDETPARRKTPVRSREKTPSTESTPPKKSEAASRDVSKEEASYEILDSVEEDVVQDEGPTTGQKTKRGRPKKQVRATQKRIATLKKDDTESKSKRKEEETYQFVDLMEKETPTAETTTEEETPNDKVSEVEVDPQDLVGADEGPDSEAEQRLLESRPLSLKSQSETESEAGEGDEEENKDEEDKEEAPPTRRRGSPRKRRTQTHEEEDKRRNNPDGPETKRSHFQAPCVAPDDKLRPLDRGSPLGQEFVVPKSGFFCNLCSIFYLNKTTAMNFHCSSKKHFDNVQKHYQKLQKEPPTSAQSGDSLLSD